MLGKMPAVSRSGSLSAFLFFGIGFAVTAAAFVLSVFYYELVQLFGLGGPTVAVWSAPVKFLRECVAYSPWIALAVMVAARLFYGRSIRLFSFAGGLATPYLAFVAFLMFWPAISDHWHRQDFDSSAWRAAVDDAWSDWPVRLTMADDLVASGVLAGKTRAEVEELLGPTTETGKFATWDMVYHLGPERGIFRIDSEWLVLKIGADGRVIEFALVKD